MFGSLVIVFPTYHEGGALFLRHHGHQWIIDPGQELTGGRLDRPSVTYVAFLNDDIEQEVAPVTSGHRVTLTYDLYYDDDGGPVSEKEDTPAPEHSIPPKPPNQDRFREAFKALLENPEFMAEGGTLAFGLRHGYPIERAYLDDLYNVLKGIDAVLFQSTRALGFEPALHMYYEDSYDGRPTGAEGVIINRVFHFETVYHGDEYLPCEIILADGGISVQEGDGIYRDPDSDSEQFKNPEPIEWVTPITTYSRQEGEYTSHEDTWKTLSAYGDLCMIVRIGKVGDRLAYPTVAEVEKAHESG